MDKNQLFQLLERALNGNQTALTELRKSCQDGQILINNLHIALERAMAGNQTALTDLGKSCQDGQNLINNLHLSLKDQENLINTLHLALKDQENVSSSTDLKVGNIEDNVVKIASRLDQIDIWQKVKLPLLIGFITLLITGLGFFLNMREIAKFPVPDKSQPAIAAPHIHSQRHEWLPARWLKYLMNRNKADCFNKYETK